MNIKRGDIWLINFNPTIRNEQAGIRPGLIISVNRFNQSMATKVVAIPLTSKDKGIPLDVELLPPDGGVTKNSYVKCEDLRSLSKIRLIEKWGEISPEKIAEVSKKVGLLLGI